MTTLKARFDGRVLVPEEPVDLPQNRVLEVTVAESVAPPNGTRAAPDNGPSLLAGLEELLSSLPEDPDSPPDLAAQHDHYLYGTPKRP